mmetsp:Transcript_43074/g.41420  ORF Transcript_43074/g.41420 Transcript_43074/m.41420 type:complete len:90 (+) Transcript_43074:1309-1578(+)|eukprot:CAMPEP_0170547498 /NCGR_PEP_ID=MMETSP0211-20121228/5914_1 /TAXON_ID=311385 /ORGANISM="Pseudokeronopsis sp., Strain OXSARD2" /LENGTH=89 /DNA_ID=CAMNT_0010852601 /DNA_START=1223 /DNA_END=1492 /DNA_ORIENTATION=+
MTKCNQLNEERDIKVTLIDFNASREFRHTEVNDQNQKVLTASLMFEKAGHPNYISPEMALGKPYTEKIDLWQAGCVMYFLLTGKEPFPQ